MFSSRSTRVRENSESQDDTTEPTAVLALWISAPSNPPHLCPSGWLGCVNYMTFGGSRGSNAELTIAAATFLEEQPTTGDYTCKSQQQGCWAKAPPLLLRDLHNPPNLLRRQRATGLALKATKQYQRFGWKSAFPATLSSLSKHYITQHYG